MNSGFNYWWNLPGSRHNNGCVFGFADGHAEYRKWRGGLIQGSYWQSQGLGTGGTDIGYTSVAATAPADLQDLAWAQAGGPLYPTPP